MADKPIPFTAPMVRALLREIEAPGTGKTMTRRIVRLPRWATEIDEVGDDFYTMWCVSRESGCIVPALPQFLPHDRLWVRERYRSEAYFDDLPLSKMPDHTRIHYEADGDAPDWAGRSRHNWFMPKWASRITLLVTDVRVERLQDISEADAIAEGIERASRGLEVGWTDYSGDSQLVGGPRSSFCTLWDKLHGPGAWDTNPWVAAITFRPVLGNIDQIKAG